MTEAQPRALIVGAGVGGLAAALALERAGMRVTLLERAPELRELGFALLLAPNAMRALRKLGVAERICERAEVGRDAELRAADGRTLKRIRLDAVRHETGEDTVCALRQVLHGALFDALRTTEVRTSAQAVGFKLIEGGVELELADGERLQAELLVGADGLHSQLRAALHGDALRASGLVGHRGVRHTATWNVTGAQYFGRGLEAGVARAGEGAVYWFVAGKSDPEQASLKPKASALAALRGFDPALIAMVEGTAEADIRRDELFDRKPLQSWGEDCVTLLGDAAHPMLPHAGQGAAQALEDAVVLGRCVAASADVPAALRRYERLRIPRTAQVVASARRNARVASLTSPWLCGLRDAVLAHGPAALVESQILSLMRVDLDA